MEKDFLMKYESEIKSIANKLIDSSKRWKLSRISEVWKDIFDEVCKCNIDMSVCSNSGYLPVHISSTYLREEDTYENLLLIFKLHNSEVLFLLTSSENSAIDSSKTNDFINKLSTKNKLKEFFSEFTQHNVDILTLLNVTEEISKNINILESRLRKADIDNLNTLFNIITEKEMLTLFGYYLYTYLYCNDKIKNKYRSIINITYDYHKNNVDEVKFVSSFLHSVMTTRKSFPAKSIFTTTDFPTKGDAFEKFKNATNNLVIVDYSTPSRKNLIKNILCIYSTLKKQKKYISSIQYDQCFNRNIIIISKKLINDELIIHIPFENLNADNYIKAKTLTNIFNKYIDEFEDFIADKYEPITELIDLTNNIEKAMKSISKSIYNTSIQDKNTSNKYAPVILALYDFFEFLQQKYYISQKDYEEFIRLCNAIYGYQNTKIDIPQINTEIDINNNIDPYIVFTKTIYELYINNIELFTDDNTKQPFRYANTKNKKEMICFKDISYVISFIKNNKDKIDSYNDFSNVFIESESTEELLQQIRNSLMENQLQVVNKNRKDYRVGKSSYFALDVAKLKEFIAQCE